MLVFLVLASTLILSFSGSKSDSLHTADSHGPISIMSDHMHKKGEIMFSYRFNHMFMNKTMNGTKSLGIDEVMSAPNSSSNDLGRYMNSPISMGMDMHMFGAMYAPSDNLTFMVMTSYIEKEMIQQRMQMSGGKRFEVNSSGIGDTRLSSLVNLFHNKRTKTHLGIGLSLPTGSIDKRDNTPVSSDARLGYGMQNGSGTFDPFFILNNVNSFGKFKLGEQIFFKLPLSGKNSEGYQHGNDYKASFWMSYLWLNNISTSININYKFKGNMEGEDDEMNPRMSPVMDSRNSGYQKINLGFGVNIINHNEFLRNHRIGIEGIFPVFQNYRGIQMKEVFKVVIGWQYGF